MFGRERARTEAAIEVATGLANALMSAAAVVRESPHTIWTAEAVADLLDTIATEEFCVFKDLEVS